MRRDMRAVCPRGFGLVELLVALTILGVGILAVAGTALVAARRLRDAELRQHAVLTAAGILDSIAFAGPPVGTGSGVLGPLEYRWSAQTAGAGVEQVSLEVRDGPRLILRFASVVARTPPAATP